MRMTNSTTRFDRLTRSQAAAVVAATLLAIVCCLFASRAGKPNTPLNVSGFTDPEVIQRIVDRVRGGQNYYQAAGEELRADRFHVRSIFNWRQPLYAWVLAAFPMAILGQILLGALAVGMTCLAIHFLLHCGGRVAAIIGLCLIPGASYGAFVGWGATTLEIWAGVLIAISVFVYAMDYWWLGLMIALLALFVREIVAPYVLVCIIVAVLNRRWREVVGWAIGLALYGGYFAWHVSRVLASIRPTDTPDAVGWLRFGGLHFILTTAAQNVIFLLVPLWVVAIYLPLALVGLASISGETGRRMCFTVVAYLAFFAFVGKSFNDYWGFVYSPLLAVGFAKAPAVVSKLCNALTTDFDEEIARSAGAISSDHRWPRSPRRSRRE
jgi:hypothetical protein